MNMGELTDEEADAQEAREIAEEKKKMKEAKETWIETQAEKEYEVCFREKQSKCLLEKEYGLNFDVSKVLLLV